MRSNSSAVRRIFRELERHSLLLVSDAAFPNIASLVAGKPVRGSWWGHPRAHEIYDLEHLLREHADVVRTKLVSGKDTFVHRRLWQALVAVASGWEPWQFDELPENARLLLDTVIASGEVRTDQVPWTGGHKKDSPGEAARELERRLLAVGEEVHTETGAHAKRLEAWDHWAKRANLSIGSTTSEQGKRELERVVATLNKQFHANGRLPWQARRVMAVKGR